MEARTCYSSKAYRATTVMVGRCLEALCVDKGVTSKPLQAGLQRLAATGAIDQRLLEWAHGLRALRNDGAHHSGERITADDARDALELAEALLDYLYVFTSKYEAFKTRRMEQSLASRSTALPAGQAPATSTSPSGVDPHAVGTNSDAPVEVGHSAEGTTLTSA
ncbi:DUF4145 domain-containing protein [Catellatospora coxensis]